MPDTMLPDSILTRSTHRPEPADKVRDLHG